MHSYQVTSSASRESTGGLAQFAGFRGSESTLLLQAVDRVILRVIRVLLEIATRLGSGPHVARVRTSSSKLPATAVSATMS